MSAPSSPVRALRARLGHLRHRIRLLLTLQGLARWIVAAVSLLVLFFLADYLLDLPLGVRRFVRLGLLDRPENLSVVGWVLLLAISFALLVWATRARLGAAPVFAFLLGGVVGALAWLGLRFIRPAGRHLPDEDLALTVEDRFRTLNDRLAAALDFEGELARPTRGESETMMRVVVDEAAEEAKHLEFARAVSGRQALGWTAGAVVSLMVGLGLAWVAGETVGLWARRSLLLEEEAWPRLTEVLAVDRRPDGSFATHDPARPFTVAVGRPLTLLARAAGVVPDEVLLLDHAEGTRPLPRRMYAAPDERGIFQLEIRDVRRPFDFVLRGGDDDDDAPVYRVEITVPPRVLALEATLTYPDYLRRPPEEIEGGDLVVPQGTEVAVRLETDVPVKRARVQMGEVVLDASPLASTGDGDADRRFAFSFRAEETARYRVLLETAEGHESDPAANTYEVRVEPDRAPQIVWLHPRGPTEVTPNGRVPLLAVATDDHAVEDLALEIRYGAERTVRLSLSARGDDAPGGSDAEGGRIGALDGPFGQEEIRVYVPLEIASLEESPGRAPVAPSRLAARLVGRDSKGQTREGPWAALDVYTAVDLERSLVNRRSSVRAAFETALADQRMRRDQLADVIDGPFGDPERDLVKSIQFAQAKIAQDVDQVTRDLVDLFNTFVYDRLGAENPNERILAILDRYHRRTYGAEPRTAEEEEADVPRVEPGDPVFPYALYDELTRAWREKVIFDSGLLDRMLKVLEPAVQLASRGAPAAHHVATRAAAGEAGLAEALAAQDAVIRSLERILESLRNWQSLNDVILTLRRLKEEQEALQTRLDQASEDDERR